jgi:predicted metal-dependent peptidase
MKQTTHESITEIKEHMKDCIMKKDVKGLTYYTEKYIELIVFKMLLASDKFYAVFIIHFNRIIDYSFPAAAGVGIKRGIINLYINPLMIVNCTDTEVNAIIKHEVFHIMNMHPQRSKENNNRYKAEIENIAMDVAINQYINGLPDWVCTIKTLEEKFEIKTYIEPHQNYEYYLLLILNSQKYKEQLQQYEEMKQKFQEALDKLKEKMGSGSGSNSNGNGDGNQQTGGAGGSDITQEDLDELMDNMTADHSSWKDSDDADINNMENIVREIANDTAKKVGNLPAGIKELIDALNEPPKISWQSEFRKMTGSVKVPYKKTPLRRDRRQPQRYDINGRISDRRIKIVVALDTSGSMSNEVIQFIFNEIFDIIHSVKFDLTIVECDCEIGRVYTAKTVKDIKYDVTGRGGTSFEPVFKYVTDDINKKLDLLIYFTDGYGDYELDERFKPRGYQLMWVLTGHNNTLSLRDAWTKRIKMLDLE